MSLLIEMRNDASTRRQIRSLMDAHEQERSDQISDHRLDLIYKNAGRVIAGAQARILCGNCYVSLLFVIPEERKRGLGSSLMNELRSFQMRMQAARMSLSTRDVEAKRFFDEREMTVDGRIRHCPTPYTLAFYSGTPRFKKVRVTPADTLLKNAGITPKDRVELSERIATDPVMGRSDSPLTLALTDREKEVKGGLIGSIRAGCLEIEALIVSSSLRGQGYGKALLEALEAYGKEKGIRRLFVRPFCFHDRGFFSHLGYRRFETPCHDVFTRSLE
ncbi:MAG: GNAT family N-acetyltransferase [Acholeplasmataceae bacterium]